MAGEALLVGVGEMMEEIHRYDVLPHGRRTEFMGIELTEDPKMPRGEMFVAVPDADGFYDPKRSFRVTNIGFPKGRRR